MASKKSRDPRQYSFEAQFFAAPPPPSQDEGSLDISNQIREAIADALAAAKTRSGGEMDRYEIATLMSRLSGRDITKNMIDRYCAPSAEDWRFPLEALPALVKATGDFSILDILAGACGCKVLRGEESWIAEFGALLLMERQLKSRLAEFKNQVPADELNRLLDEISKRQGGKP